MVKTYKNFIDKNENDLLLNYCKNIDESIWGVLPESYNNNNFWDGRTIQSNQIFKDNKKIYNILNKYKNNLINNIKKDYKVLHELYNDTMSIVRWPVGYELFPHADGEEPDGSEHPFPWREYGCVIYLNDDFKGGEIYYPNLNLQPKIESRMAAAHQSNIKCLHGVKPVTEGMRYTIGFFVTSNINYALKYGK